MSETIDVKVGKRGEIYTTSKMRRRIGLAPGGRATLTIEGDKLIVQPKPTALSLLEKPRINVKPIKSEELSLLRREISEEIENR